MLPERIRNEIETTADKVLHLFSIICKNGQKPLYLADIEAVVHSRGYKLRKYSELTIDEMNKICSTCKAQLPPGVYLNTDLSGGVIFYNDMLSINEIAYTLIHELAHAELGHTEPCTLAESQANYYADYVLSHLSGVKPVKPEVAPVLLQGLCFIGAVLLSAAVVYYLYKKQKAA